MRYVVWVVSSDYLKFHVAARSPAEALEAVRAEDPSLYEDEGPWKTSQMHAQDLTEHVILDWGGVDGGVFDHRATFAEILREVEASNRVRIINWSDT